MVFKLPLKHVLSLKVERSKMAMRKVLAFLTLVLFATALPSFADAVYSGSDPANVPPPAGAILDLAGGPILSGYNLYSISFTAAASTTSSDVTFLFRNDAGYTAFDDASIVDTTHASGNLFTNGGFETGSLSPWNYDNIYGAPFGGVVAGGGNSSSTTCMTDLAPNSGAYFWCDGATQAYDAIATKPFPPLPATPTQSLSIKANPIRTASRKACINNSATTVA
jgi:hypothetical protein